MTLDVWLNAGFLPVRDLPAIAIEAEHLGYAGIDLPDHLLFPPSFSSEYPYSDDGAVLWPAKAPWPDPWVAIGAMAAVTSTLRFATGVLIAPLRDPFSLAKSVATANELSQGRLHCGFGVGWMREEFDVLGIDFGSRGRRLDEILIILRLLWSGAAVSFDGEFFSFDQITTRPKVPDMRIHIGGNSTAALRRAARNEGWIGTHRTMAATAGLIDQLRPLLEGRDDFDIALTGPDLLGESPDAMAALGVKAITLPIAAIGRANLAKTARDLGLEPAR